MDAAVIEFMTESMTLYLREFFASHMGTLLYFSKESLANALTYSEMLVRDKDEKWKEQCFPFDCTPAIPVNGAVKVDELIYNVGVGDRPQIPVEKDKRILRFGRQEVIQPGSIFRAVLWGDLPILEKGQTFLIGKKRGTAVITEVKIVRDVEATRFPSGIIMPIQILPGQISVFSSYQPLVAMNRFLIVKVPARAHDKWLNVERYSVPLVSSAGT